MKNNDVNFDYYQVTLFGFEDEPEVVIAANKEEARAEAKLKYGDKMVKSVVRVTGYDLASEPGEVARKQFYGNLQALSGKTSFKLSEAYRMLKEDEVGTVYHTSFEKVDKHRNTPMWFSHNMQQAKGWHANMMDNEDEAYTHAAQIKGKIAHHADPEVQAILKKAGTDKDEYADHLVSNPTADEVMDHPGTKALIAHGYVGHTHSDYDPHDWNNDHDSTVVFNPAKHAEHKGSVEMNESLKPSDPISNYIRDFQQSNAPQFKGKSKSKRREMAIAAKLTTEEVNPIMEGEDKLLYLARIGLMDKNEVLLLKRALHVKRSGQPMSVKHRDILLKLMEKLVGMITMSPHMFNRARHKVMEDVMNEYGDREIAMHWNDLTDYITEAGYMDPPRTKADAKKRYPNIQTDVKNKNSRDLQPVRFK